jgi:cobalt-zinc-cadmium efflux system membrane fusion protein
MLSGRVQRAFFAPGGTLETAAPPPAFELAGPNLLRFTPDGVRQLQISTTEVRPAPAPPPLLLPGSVTIDPNRMVRVHSRFAGEVASIGQVPDRPTDSEGLSHNGMRPLRYGDHVTQGQVLAIVWSKDIGEKKSELVDAITRTSVDRAVLTRLHKAPKDLFPARTIEEAKRAYESDLVAVARAERTLRSWRLTEDEINAVRDEAAQVERDPQREDKAAARSWAQTEVRSPLTGVIVEKNFNVGDMVDPAADLFKVADLSRVQITVSVYEEDLPPLRALQPDERHWSIDIKADPNDVPVAGTFDVIGDIIDPTQHSGVVIGWLDNSRGHLTVGQFITATVPLPVDPRLVVVPPAALLEEANHADVLVEVDATRREYRRQPVAVVRRQEQLITIRSQPTPDEVSHGCQPLLAGQRVISAGGLELSAELTNDEPQAR